MRFESPPDAAWLPDWLTLALAGGWAQIAVLAAILGFLLLGLRRAIGGRRRRSCRWKKDARRKGVTLERWVCTACGVDAFTSDGRPPKDCKRAVRDAGL